MSRQFTMWALLFLCAFPGVAIGQSAPDDCPPVRLSAAAEFHLGRRAVQPVETSAASVPSVFEPADLRLPTTAALTPLSSPGLSAPKSIDEPISAAVTPVPSTPTVPSRRLPSARILALQHSLASANMNSLLSTQLSTILASSLTTSLQLPSGFALASSPPSTVLGQVAFASSTTPSATGAAAVTPAAVEAVVAAVAPAAAAAAGVESGVEVSVGPGGP